MLTTEVPVSILTACLCGVAPIPALVQYFTQHLRSLGTYSLFVFIWSLTCYSTVRFAGDEIVSFVSSLHPFQVNT